MYTSFQQDLISKTRGAGDWFHRKPRQRRKTKWTPLCEDIERIFFFWEFKKIWLGDWKSYLTQREWAFRRELLFMFLWKYQSMCLHERVGRTWRFPVVLWPPANIVVLVVLFLQPFNERFEILHERLGTHLGLTGDHGHSLGPGLTEAQLHHITANDNRSERSEEMRISGKRV